MPTTARLSFRQRLFKGSFSNEEVLKAAFGLYAIFGLVSMATMSVTAGLLILAILFTSKKPALFHHELVREGGHPASRVYLWLSFALALAAALSLWGGQIFPLSYGGHHSEIHFLKDIAKVWYLFWPIPLVIGLRRLNPTDQKWVLHTWLAAFGVLSLLGVTQFFHGWPRPQRIPGEVEHFHTTLFLGHHLSVASIFIFPLFVALDSAWNFRGKPRGKFLFLLAFGLGLLALFFTYSRTLWIALPLGLLVWVLWRLPKKWSLATIGVGIICGILLTQYPPIQKRIHDGLGVGTRQNLWSANWEFFKQRPLTGVGWRHNHELAGYYLMEKLQTNDVFSGHAHNNALDMLGGMGGLGLLAWIAWCGGALWLLLRKSSQKSLLSDFAVGLVCAWLVFQINGLTQVNFWEAKVQHQMAWIIAWSLL